MGLILLFETICNTVVFIFNLLFGITNKILRTLCDTFLFFAVLSNLILEHCCNVWQYLYLLIYFAPVRLKHQRW